MKIIIQRHFNVFGVCEFRVAGVIIGKDSCLSSIGSETNARLFSKIDALREQFNTTKCTIRTK